MAKKSSKQKLNSVGAYANEYMLNHPDPVNIDNKTLKNKVKNNYVNTKNNNTVLYTAKNSGSYSSQITGSYLYKSVSTDLKDYINNWSITIRPKDVINVIGLMI